ncbi:MAG: ATP-binding protein [Lachnospiraceae bacterium]|nr:ATP-binding protein [Lachnospiraceae bacterium]
MKKIVLSKQSKLSLLFMLSLCIAMVYMLLSSIQKYSEDVMNGEKQQLLTVASSSAQAIESYLAGCCQDITAINDTQEFAIGIEEYRKRGDAEALDRMANNFMRSYYPNIADIRIYDDNGMNIVNLRARTYRFISLMGTNGKYKIDVCQDDDDKMYFALSFQADNHFKTVFYLDCETIFYSLMSNLKLGEKGYIMVKASNGTIVMHEVKEQVGMDVIKDRQERFPGVDLSELSELVKHQLAGETGTQIYHSYWWAEAHTNLQRVRKFAAYTPAVFGDGFLTVSAVADYEEFNAPLTIGIVKMASLFFVLVFSILCTVIFMLSMYRKQYAYAKENEYLKELNKTLEDLHKSESYISHQQRLQVIGTMTGGIAHEFNNLLTPIMGYAGLMLGTVDKNEPYYGDIEEIYDAAEKAKDIIVQIASLSKKNTETVYQYWDLDTILHRCIKMVESVCPYNIELKQEISCEGKGIFANKTQLNQVILNVCVNAFHAIGKENGSVYFRAEIVDQSEVKKHEIDTSAGGEYVRIEVADNGCGMDETTLSQIFTPFFTTKNVGEGVGLGLSMVMNIVESHHGVIRVESKVGEGTRFRIYFPTCQDIVKEDPEHETKSIAGIGKILVVSDNLKILKLLEKGLRQEKQEVVTASNAQKALEELHKNKFDIVIADYDLPKENGVDLAFDVKSFDSRIAVLIMTSIYRKDVLDAKENGIITDHLEKPIVLTLLFQKISEILIDRSE